MNEPRVVESVTNECQLLGRAHESSSARAEQLIACLEGEIAKRDEELAACRVAVENCDLFRARIAELEGTLDTAVSWDVEQLKVIHSLNDHNDQLRAELAAIKAQEPVEYQQLSRYENWDRVDKAVFELGLLSSTPERFRALYAAPVAKPQVMMPKRIQIAGHLSAVEGYRASGWNQCLDEVARLNAAPVQQVSVPDGWRLVPTKLTAEMERELNRSYGGWGTLYQVILDSAPAAPAADAGVTGHD